MPRLAKDYQKGLIYKLCCNDITIKDIYIGSTTDFTRRKCCHKQRCNNPNSKEYNFKVYQFIRENNGWDNWNMVLVEKYPCENSLELVKRERYFQETLESKLNSRLSQRTQKEWRRDNREKIKEKKKVYRENNDEKIKKQKKVYSIENVDKIKEYKKVYYIENVDKIKELQKVYRENNAEKIKERKKIRVICECGLEVNKNHISRHHKSQKHLKLLEQKLKI